MASAQAANQVTALYKELFKRLPGDAAMAYWGDLIDSGRTITQLRGYLAASPEGTRAVRDRVTEIYREKLGREPDPGGLDHWASQFLSGKSVNEISSNIASTEEGRAYAETQIASPIVGPNPTDVQTGNGPINTTDTTPIAPATPINPADVDYSVLRTMLRDYGLDSLYDTAVNLITDGASSSEIELKLRETEAFRQRFSVIFQREQAGLPAISPAEVIAYEKQLSTMTSYYGVPIPVGDSVQSMAGRLLGGDVSLNELSERLTAQRVFARQVLEDPNQDREAVAALLGQGVTLYDIAEMALDPSKTLDQVQRRLEAAAVANEAGKANYRLTADEATDLARQGLTGDEARQGFTSLAVQSQVVNGLGAEADPVSRQQELAALTGDQTAINAIETSRRNRVAANAEGGGFATTKEGFGGLR